MKRSGTLFLVAFFTLALGVTISSAKEYVVNGQVSATPPAATTSPTNQPLPDDNPVIDEELIDFDDLTPGGTFGSGVVVSNEYADQGIVFQGAGEVLNESGNFGISNYSSPNFLAFNTNAGVPGPETMLFDPPATVVSFFAGHSSSGTIFVDVYDSQDNLVGDETMNGGSALQEFILTEDDISRVVVSFSGTVMCIDNITFDSVPGGPIDITLFPIQTTVPAGGGNIVYDAQLISTLNQTYPGVLFWTEVTRPDGQVVGPLTQIQFTLTPFMNVFQSGRTQFVPGNAPAGTYEFKAKVGYPNGPQIDDAFDFVKSGVVADAKGSWHGTPFDLAGEGVAEVNLPSKFALEAAYPNPFNAATVLNIALPEAAELNVTVFNTLGQQVAQLADGQFQAGQHKLTFDASNLTSGLYFVRATVPGQLNATQKVMLVR